MVVAKTVVLFDVDNTLLDNDQIAVDLTQHLDEEIGSRGERQYWAIFEELRTQLGYVDYLGALQRYRQEYPRDPHLLTLSRFLLNYPFAERLFPQAREVVRHVSQWAQAVILSDGDVVFQPRKIDRSGLFEVVEGHVLIVERWIRFQLRKRVFTSLGELNRAIRELLIHLNAKPFQKLPGCRASSFEVTDRPALQKLPARPYEYVEFRRARVGMDKMIDVDGRLFSVPAKLVSEEVDIRVTSSAVEVMHAGRRVASHIRTPGNKPVIDQTHLTAADQAYGMWSPEREIEWAKSIGPSTVEFVSQRLAASGNKTMGYRLGMGLRKLAGEYGDQRMETTCKRALESGATRVSSLRAILANRLDVAGAPLMEADFDHENLRGPGYYH